MRAIYIRQHGEVDGLKVSDIPAPLPADGEALVRIDAAGINPSDVAGVQGRFPGSVLPRVVGRDFAGTVVEGPAELIGTEVWGTGGDLGITRDGTHAEFVAIPRQAVARRPKSLSAVEAAAVGVPFVTAFSALVRLGMLKEGEWAIVSGAAGAVGQAAIQLAHAMGARVVALVKNATQRWVAETSEVEAIAQADEGNLDLVVRRATNGMGADVALNGVGSSIFGVLLGALAPGGRQVIYSAAGGREFTLDLRSLYRNQSRLLGLDTQKFNAVECAGILNQIAPLFESAALRPPSIASRFALADAARAYRLVAAGGAGKLVLLP